MKSTSLFVINPISGDQDKESTTVLIKRWCQSLDHTHVAHHTTGKNDLDRLREKIQQEKPDYVVSVGGDGTVKLCAEALKDTNIPLGIIPMGSANGMATELGIPENAQKALSIIKHGKVKRIDLLRFNGELLGIHISDVGANASLVKHFEKSERRGFLGYASGVIRQLQNPETFQIELTIDGKEYREQGIMVALANAKRYGTGALLNNVGKLDDGLMEVCIVKKLDITDLAEHFIQWVSRDSDHIVILQGREVSLRIDRGMPFQVDGEFIGSTTEVEAVVEPRCLSVLLPS